MQDKPEADLLIVNSAQIITCGGSVPKIGKDMRDIGLIEHGAVACRGKHIVWVGESNSPKSIPVELTRDAQIIYADNQVVMPGFVDPHTHLVFGGSREEEFAKKLQGVPYLEILERGGGILSTVEKTRAAPQKNLQNRAMMWLNKMLAHGSTTVEIKSGYGLGYYSEIFLLRIINNLKEILREQVDIVPTFLGAHAWPKEMNHKDYMGELYMVMTLLSHMKDAEFCDVFCEKGAFSLEESRHILEYAKVCGMKPKIHAGEMTDLRGGELAAYLGVTSLDHGEHISDDQVEMLARRRIPIVLMPGVNFHLMTEAAPARKFINMGVPIALATDFNPGSSPILSMQYIIQLACRMYQMTMEEAINAATINAAYALDRAGIVGSIEAGKQADLLVLDIPNYQQLPYWINQNLVQTVIKKGRIVYSAPGKE